MVEVPGFEPGAFRMQSERDTTTPHPQRYQSFLRSPLSNAVMPLSKLVQEVGYKEGQETFGVEKLSKNKKLFS